ncbi:hypothetical protein SAMN05421853_103312 [Roseivivax halotolerans]|uniref:Uncharacterized protein n=1 Tax=Roseivivax halotolerans TaxID=93684 RepID=A0A1I5XDW4_9RHOB|nr:hypothetical protein [Roseivivax halotolerans]SFQ29847.1 hypothetical protein SAMN05421853_103312 [Roseivivax halotolerans]
MEQLVFLAFGLMALPEDDKRAHFLAGRAITEIGQADGLDPLEACGVTLLAGVAKEMADIRGPGDASLRDGLATVAGCGITYRF